jgi:hypothetical protein
MVRSYLVAGAWATVPVGWLATPSRTPELTVPRLADRVRALAHWGR